MITNIPTTQSTSNYSGNLTSYAEVKVDIYVFLRVMALSIFSFCGIVFNMTLIVLVSVKPQLKSSPTFIIIRSLSMADLLSTLVFGTKLILDAVSQSWILGDLGCKLFLYVIFIFAVASLYHLAFFSVFRYVLLVHPLFAKSHITTQKVVLATISIWIYSLSISLISLFANGMRRDDKISNAEMFTCGLLRLHKQQAIVQDLINVYGPLSVIIGFHIAKWRALANNSRIGPIHQVKEQTVHVSTPIIMAVIVIHSCFLIPVGTIEILEGFTGNLVNDGARLPIMYLLLLSSCINPVLYFFISRKLTKELTNLCRKKSTVAIQKYRVHFTAKQRHLGDSHAT